MPRRNAIESAIDGIRSSHMPPLLAIGLLALLLQIPISMIGGRVGERSGRRDAAVSEGTEKRGQPLQARGDPATETRMRGIFSIPVYGTDVALTGAFARPDASRLGRLGIDSSTLAWNRALLMIAISDPRDRRNQAAADWPTPRVRSRPVAAWQCGPPPRTTR